MPLSGISKSVSLFKERFAVATSGRSETTAELAKVEPEHCADQDEKRWILGAVAREAKGCTVEYRVVTCHCGVLRSRNGDDQGVCDAGPRGVRCEPGEETNVIPGGDTDVVHWLRSWVGGSHHLLLGSAR